jgi:hypothetical protein
VSSPDTPLARSVREARIFGLMALLAAGTGPVLIPLSRTAAVIWATLLLTSVVVPLRYNLGSWSRASLATLVGAAPAVVLLGVAHDLSGFAIPVAVAGVLLQFLWMAGSLTLGRTIAMKIPAGRPSYDVWVRIGAIGAVTTYVGGAMGRLLLPSASTAERLAWMLDEEDNAQIVGVAREVLLHGPRGLELADQYGTAFINLPLALLGLFGGPLLGETDPRLQAVSLVVLSTLVAVVLAGVAMALLAALPHHIQSESRMTDGASPTWLRISLGAALSAITALIGFSLLVVLPMRTGFLTFVWGLVLVLLSAALVAATPADAGAAARLLLIAHLVGSGLLLLSSWPFIGPALAPLVLVVLVWLRPGVVSQLLRSHPGRALATGIAITVGIGLLATWFLRWGPLAEVLSYGVELLTVGGSGIYADPMVGRAAAVAVVATTAIVASRTRGRSRSVQLLAIAGPILGAGVLHLGLRWAAAVLADGAVGYSSVKLLYGVLVLGAVLGLVGLASQATRVGTAAMLGALALVVTTHQMSPTARLHLDWWSHTLRVDAPHARAAVDAILSTDVDVPIRCLPNPGTPVDDRTRWAAYFCARWMEDAFNEGRFDGRRFELLGAPGPDFGPTIDRIVAESQSEYLFAYRMTMGAGWFGWSGRAE